MSYSLAEPAWLYEIEKVPRVDCWEEYLFSLKKLSQFSLYVFLQLFPQTGQNSVHQGCAISLDTFVCFLSTVCF